MDSARRMTNEGKVRRSVDSHLTLAAVGARGSLPSELQRDLRAVIQDVEKMTPTDGAASRARVRALALLWAAHEELAHPAEALLTHEPRSRVGDAR